MSELARRTLLKAGGVATAALAAPLGAAPRASAAPHGATVLASGLKVPWGIVFVEGGNALVGERDTCDIYRVAPSGGKVRVGRVPGITRLMALAKSPVFSTDRWIFAFVLTSSDARIIRFQYVNGRLGATRVVFAGIPLGADHPGGGLAFRSGLLYASVGDMAMPHLARDRRSLVGKTLRLTWNGTVPSGNPFGASPVYSVGHRNVECLCVDTSGRLWAPEFGESRTDELNQIVAGGDYGWPDYEGGDGAGPVRDPFVTWSPTSYCSPAGVAVKGDYAYVSALAGQALFRVGIASWNARQVTRYYFQTYRRLRSVALAPDGSLWMMTANNTARYARDPSDDRVIRVLT